MDQCLDDISLLPLGTECSILRCNGAVNQLPCLYSGVDFACNSNELLLPFANPAALM